MNRDDYSVWLWLLHCKQFPALILDEVHLAAADHFQAACRLRANVASMRANVASMAGGDSRAAVKGAARDMID